MKPEDPPVESVMDFVTRVHQATDSWRGLPACSPWFRGQSNCLKPPTPSILRHEIDEAALVTRFRNLAPMFGDTPPRNEKDKWLYLMQHVGAPTRLLDWTEGALIGLYFAVEAVASGRSRSDENPGVWVLHPLELNRSSICSAHIPDRDSVHFGTRCDLAFGITAPETNVEERKYPIAILADHVHPRMKSQKGCFTLHGADCLDFENLGCASDLADDGFFLKYEVDRSAAGKILDELRWLGITHCALFPDHDGLATELRRIFIKDDNSCAQKRE